MTLGDVEEGSVTEIGAWGGVMPIAPPQAPSSVSPACLGIEN